MTKTDHGTVEAARLGIPRSPAWRAVEPERRRIELAFAARGAGTSLQIHHMSPFLSCIAHQRIPEAG